MPDPLHLILCPVCSWKPDGGEYWECSCGNIWDTFQTYGKCPACGKVHLTTQCIACGQTSPHHEWYIDPIELPEEREKAFSRVRR